MIGSINTNVPSLVAGLNLQRAGADFASSLEKLSTGFRINDSGDDPSGLVISEFQRSQISGIDEAISNIDRAINLAQTAEGGLAEIANLLTELKGIVVDSANNGVLDERSLEANQANIVNILDTIDRIANTTKFGQTSLLDGSSGRKVLSNNASVEFLNSDDPNVVVNQELQVEITQNAERGFVAAATAQTGALTQNEILFINGVKIQLNTGMEQSDVIGRINAHQGTTGVFAVDNGGTTELRTLAFGQGAAVVAVSDVAASATSSGFGTLVQIDRGINLEGTIGNGVAGVSGSTAGATNSIGRVLIGTIGEAAAGVSVQIGFAGGDETAVSTEPIAAGDASIFVVDNSRLFHLGEAAFDNAMLTLGKFDSEALGIGLPPTAQSTKTVSVNTTMMNTDTSPPDVRSPDGPATVTDEGPQAEADFEQFISTSTAPPVINSTFNRTVTTMQSGNQLTVTTVDTTTTMTSQTTTENWEHVIIQTATGNVTAISDDFDPTSDPATFASLNNGVVAGSPAGEFNGSNAFLFNGSGARFADTQAFNMLNGGTISFVLKIGGPNDTATFEDADHPEDVLLQFSINGGTTFTTMQTFDTEDPTYQDTWGSFSAAIPLAAQTASTIFRFNQPTHSGTIYDNWAIDDFNLQLNGTTRSVAPFTITKVTETTMVTEVTTVEVFTIDEDPRTPNLRSIDVRTLEGAQSALKIIDRSINEVATARGEIGAFQQNTLEATQSNVRNRLVNLESAESSLRDTDFGEEIINFTGTQIRRNIVTAMLTLANQNKRTLVGLLQG